MLPMDQQSGLNETKESEIRCFFCTSVVAHLHLYHSQVYQNVYKKKNYQNYTKTLPVYEVKQRAIL